jgi:hypothetical protein
MRRGILKMGFLVKEYEIPLLGKVELLDSNGGYTEHFNGKYYAQSSLTGVFVKKCESVEELMGKVSSEIKKYIKDAIVASGNKITREQKRKNDLETTLEKINVKESDSQKEFDWLKQYQTDNPLQLEIQDAEKQKGIKFKWGKE